MAWYRRWLNPHLVRLVLVLAVFAFAGVAWGQEEAPVAEAAGGIEAQGMTISQIMEYGGWIMYVLAAISVVCLAMIIYFVVVLREEVILPSKFISGLRDLLATGRITEARQACESNTSSISSIMSSALDYVQQNEQPDSAMLKEIVEGEGSRQATLIQNQTQYLVDISASSPPWSACSARSWACCAPLMPWPSTWPRRSRCCSPPACRRPDHDRGGLCVAIPAMMAYAYFRGRTAKLVANLEKNSPPTSRALIFKGAA
jgi:biopolymer transport protein ExbB/TolQ